MNELARGPQLDLDELERQIVARDRELDNGFSKDLQLMAIANARRIAHRPAGPRGQAAPDPRPGARPADRRTPQHPDPQDARRAGDQPRLAGDARPTARRSPGLYAAGEVAGFGGGGVHGYNALEGTFLGGCIFSGPGRGTRARADPTLTSPDLGSTACRTRPRRTSAARTQPAREPACPRDVARRRRCSRAPSPSACLLVVGYAWAPFDLPWWVGGRCSACCWWRTSWSSRAGSTPCTAGR